MWTRAYTKTFKGVKKEQIWKLWSDVDQWPLWDPDIESAMLEGEFKAGNFFVLKPKGWKSVRIQLTEGVKNKTFTDCTPFFGARMYGRHEMEETKAGLKLTTTMTVSGLLSFLWVRLVAQGIVNTLPTQINALVTLAKKNKK